MFKYYRKKGTTLIRPYVPGEDMSQISVNDADILEEGGMICRMPGAPMDQWYISKEYFEANYELIP